MKYTFLMILGVVAAMGFVAQTASADMVLYIDDLATAGLDVLIVDGDAAGTAVDWTATTSTIADPDGLDNGVISFNGALAGSVFTLNVTTGVSKPVIGPTRIDLNSVNVSGTGAGTLYIGLTDTDFLLGGAGPFSVANHIGGTTDGDVWSTFSADEDNLEMGTGNIGWPLIGPLGPGAFAASLSVSGLGAGDFSLSNTVTVHHYAAGDITSFNSTVVAIPAPGAMLLGLIGLGCVARIRRRVS